MIKEKNLFDVKGIFLKMHTAKISEYFASLKYFLFDDRDPF